RSGHRPADQSGSPAPLAAESARWSRPGAALVARPPLAAIRFSPQAARAASLRERADERDRARPDRETRGYRTDAWIPTARAPRRSRLASSHGLWHRAGSTRV